MFELLSTFFMGAIISGGLIIAIGSQNAFLLKTGLTNNHPFAAATVCFVGDILLIGAGVFGVGALFSVDSVWGMGLSIGGAAFLTWYGSKALKDAIKGEGKLTINEEEAPKATLKATLLMAFAMTFLNPHVYIDTVVLVGGVTAGLTDHLRPWFVAGALFASAIWFYSLVFVAKKLAKTLNNPKAWRVINSLIAALMFLIAAKLITDVWMQIAG
ncbi:L-lysine exporter family protein LysE/ArgO [Pseudidiomarina planktonica]|uniref:L-lysine exporter family protein LysE/ArgO n=1 Tax=Pseudidiomarina planktonica TaxID=1323738 RepID=A0A1Y6FW18_9GAMM|nr:LysE/ArgO family amino acid transporter [Pseudidiomarina planktonica]RUO63946.1 amino acid transporter [Pseudidiomarina planktonica]SMQ79970.1 L-lysine exporter family protein LysE/ArgO [Pseudidiomarina planktonica]